jgi:cytochrome c5
MLGNARSIAFIAAAALVSLGAQDALQLKSVNVDWPAGDSLFAGGAAADAINNNCLACHSAGMVLTQPILSRAEWQSEVDKMRNIYEAPVGAEDVPAIVDYLVNRGG